MSGLWTLFTLSSQFMRSAAVTTDLKSVRVHNQNTLQIVLQQTLRKPQNGHYMQSSHLLASAYISFGIK